MSTTDLPAPQPVPAREDTITLVLDPRAAGTSATSRPVLAAALSLFDERSAVRLLCVLDRDPGLDDLRAFLSDCADVVDLAQPGSPDVVLVGPGDADRLDGTLRIAESGGAGHDRHVIALLQSLATHLREERSPTAAPDAAPYARAREIVAEVLRDADAGRRDRADHRVRVLVVAQNLHTWGCLAPVVAALGRREDVTVTVVAVDDPNGAPGAVAAALAAQGIPAHDAADVAGHLEDADVVLLSDPYDEFRPPSLQVLALLDRGLRLAYSPYAENIGGEVTRQYDTPLHNLAWRVFVPDAVQRSLYARHCTSGAGHVRALGSLKADWLSTDEAATYRNGVAIRRSLGTRTVVVWNPHFRIEESGWSTFELYLHDLLAFTRATPKVGIIVRPHPRLFADTEASGPAGRATVAGIRDAWRALPNAVLDESRDYRPAFAASDAMVSDLSSLIPEYLRTGKPVAYLRHPDPPATVGDDAWLPRVTVVDDAAALTRYLRGVTRHRAPHAASPGACPDTGAGERVAAAIVADLRAEVWGAGA